MMISVIYFIVLLLSVSVIFVIYRIRKYSALAEPRMKMTALLLLVLMLLAVSESGLSGDLSIRMVFYLLLTLVPLFLIASTVYIRRTVNQLSIAVITLQLILLVYNLLCHFGRVSLLKSSFYISGSLTIVVLLALFYMCRFGMKVYDVHSLLQNSSGWSWLCLGVDFLYLLSLLVITSLYIFFSRYFPGSASCMASLFLGLMAVSLSFRTAWGAVFVLCPRHERRIVESMKISRLEVPNDSSRKDAVYKDVYDRIVAYFESEKPYLNSELTINDVVSVVYSNKVYISRAISQYTGRNFCQFVNYYRIMFAVETFRQNDELRISDLANLCGFNSVVSFNMAFRLFMKENPSDWCRREKRKEKK